MPFTPAHAVVAVPFARTPLLPAAVAVGAMAPDLPLFVRGTPLSYEVTHTHVAAAAAVALLLLALWYAVLRPAVRELSPRWLARRLPRGWDATGVAAWRELRGARASADGAGLSTAAVAAALVALSLVVGVLSHIGWDAFTHEGRWGVELVPALGQQWGPLLGYKWLQYGSGVLGVVVLAVCAAVWLRRRPVGAAERVLPDAVRIAWWVSLPVILAGAWISGILAHGPLREDFTAAHLGYLVLPPACALWGLLSVALAIVVQVRRRAASVVDVVTRADG